MGGSRVVVVDNSILSSVAKCRTYAAVTYCLDLQPKAERMELRAGSDIHEALAVWVTSGGDAKAAMRRFKKRYRLWAQDNVPAEDRLAYLPLAKILTHWLDTHPLAEFPFALDPKHVELAWQRPLLERDGVDVVYAALLDGIARRPSGGGVFPLDHKTGRALTDYWKERHEDSSQFSGQMWLGQMEWNGDLAGIVVNGIEVPQLNSSPRRCSRHGTPYAECALAHLRHQVVIVTRSPQEIAAWHASALSLTKTYLRLRERVTKAADVTRVPMDGRFNGGCAFCSARAWCRVGRPVNAMGDFFVKGEPWNPLALSGKRGGVKSASTPA